MITTNIQKVQPNLKAQAIIITIDPQAIIVTPLFCNKQYKVSYFVPAIGGRLDW